MVFDCGNNLIHLFWSAFCGARSGSVQFDCPTKNYMNCHFKKINYEFKPCSSNCADAQADLWFWYSFVKTSEFLEKFSFWAFLCFHTLELHLNVSYNSSFMFDATLDDLAGTMNVSILHTDVLNNSSKACADHLHISLSLSLSL